MYNVAVFGGAGVGKKTFCRLFELKGNSKMKFEVYNDFREILVNLVSFDSVVNLLDEKMVYDRVGLKEVVDAIGVNEKEYGVGTNLMLCVNKCDKLDYDFSEKDESFVLNDGGGDLYAGLDEFVGELAKERVSGHCIFGREAFVLEAVRWDKIKGMDGKDLDFYGELDQGRNSWRKKNESGKQLFLNSLKKRVMDPKYRASREVTTYFDIVEMLEAREKEFGGSNVKGRMRYVEKRIDGVKDLREFVEDDGMFSIVKVLVERYCKDRKLLGGVYERKLSVLLEGVMPLGEITFGNIGGYEEVVQSYGKYDRWNKLLGVEKCQYYVAISTRICEIYLENLSDLGIPIGERIDKLLMLTKKHSYKVGSEAILGVISGRELEEVYIRDAGNVVNMVQKLVAEKLISGRNAVELLSKLMIRKIKYYQCGIYEDVDSILNGLCYCYGLSYIVDKFEVFDAELHLKMKVLLDNVKINLSLALGRSFVVDDAFFEGYEKRIYAEKYLLTLLREFPVMARGNGKFDEIEVDSSSGEESLDLISRDSDEVSVRPAIREIDVLGLSL